MNIGIVVPHTGSSQISFYAIKEINSLIENGYKHDVILFFEHLISPIIKPLCGMMCINELMSFRGILINTTIDNTIMACARTCDINNQIIFYVWNLEWMRREKNIYLYNYNAFKNAHKLIARSENHAKAIENYSNRKVDKILAEFNVEEIIK